MSLRGRRAASVVLVVLGALLTLAGTLALYARTQVVETEAFADRAEAALRDDEVRHLVGREIVVNLVDRGSTDLVAARPLIESVVEAVLDTEPFRRLFRAAAVQANRVLFVRDSDNVALDLSAATNVVRFGLRSVDPKLAEQIPRELEPDLLKLGRGDFSAGTLRFAGDVRLLGVVLPGLALLVLAAAVVVAPDRRIGLLRSGVGVGAAGALLTLLVLVLGLRTVAGVSGEDEVTDAEVQGAVGGLLDAYFADLLAWGLGVALAGLVVAGAATALEPEHLDDPSARLRRRLLARPASRRGRALRGLALVAAGAWIALDPSLALRAAAVVAGALLVFAGTSELLAPLLARDRRPGAPETPARTRRRTLAVTGAVGVLAVGGVTAGVLAATSGDEEAARADAVPAAGCNGSPALCALRLDEAVFAGTHNSFSAADSPGWFIANQRRTIPRQLRDGIRLFLIDPHWGVADAQGRVRTDFEAEGRERNRVAKGLPPSTLKAAEALAGGLGLRGEGGGERDVWLCHTVCELGATPMDDALAAVRDFLAANRGEVVILFIEPYVKPRDIARKMREAGLERHLVTLRRDAPLPTLGRLVRDDRRLVVLTEKDADGTYPWYLDGFAFVQDTPLRAKRVPELSCRRYRGTDDSPLLMLNHWADLFPPRLEANRPFQKEDVVLRRARRCARERGRPVNLIAADFYDQGRFIEAVADLNAERVRARADRTGP